MTRSNLWRRGRGGCSGASHHFKIILGKGIQTFALNHVFWLCLHHQAWLKTQRGQRTGFLIRTSVAAISASASLTPVSPSITAAPVDRACVTAVPPTAAPYRLVAGTIPYECASRATRNPETFSRTGSSHVWREAVGGAAILFFPHRRPSPSLSLWWSKDSSVMFNLQLKFFHRRIKKVLTIHCFSCSYNLKMQPSVIESSYSVHESRESLYCNNGQDACKAGSFTLLVLLFNVFPSQEIPYV